MACVQVRSDTAQAIPHSLLRHPAAVCRAFPATHHPFPPLLDDPAHACMHAKRRQ